MDGLWFSLLIVWAFVEGVQYFRKIPFPRRMIAPLVWVVCLSGLISVGQAPQEAGFGYVLRFFVGALISGIFGAFFYGFRLVLAKIWIKFSKEDKKNEISPQGSATELHWEIALHEFMVRRRPGLWSKAFSQAQGNEELAKANYLNARVLELLNAEEFGNAQIAMWTDRQ